LGVYCMWRTVRHETPTTDGEIGPISALKTVHFWITCTCTARHPVEVPGFKMYPVYCNRFGRVEQLSSAVQFGAVEQLSSAVQFRNKCFFPCYMYVYSTGSDTLYVFKMYMCYTFRDRAQNLKYEQYWNS
jgi:hypothetical protein